jgi:glycosyltransferase involved in cell wall biosynthesis
MKILIVENNPQHGGGCETMSLQIGTELNLRGHDIYLAHESQGTMVETYSTFAKGIFRLNLTLFSWRRLKEAIRSIQCLAREIKKHKIDVVFTSHLGHIRDLSLLKTFYDVPSVFYLGLPPYDQPHDNSRISELSRTLAVKNIFAGVACSNWIAEMWKKAGWPSKTIHVVPHWVDTDKFKPASNKRDLRYKLNLPLESRIVLYVGRVVENKGVEVLLNAFSKIKAQVANVELVIVGPITRDYLIQLISIADNLHISERVKIAGAVNNSQDYFAAADVVVVPSIVEEAFGIVAIEAMSCGVITIVSSSGELPAVMGNENRDLVFGSGNTTELADKLVQWLREPHNAILRANELRQHVILNYTQNGKLDVYEDIMKSACKLRGLDS